MGSLGLGAHPPGTAAKKLVTGLYPAERRRNWMLLQVARVVKTRRAVTVTGEVANFCQRLLSKAAPRATPTIVCMARRAFGGSFTGTPAGGGEGW